MKIRPAWHTAVASLLAVMALADAPMLSAQNVKPTFDEKKNAWGFIGNNNGKWVLKPKFEKAEEFKPLADGKLRSVVTSRGLMGLVDENGKLLTPGAVFESIEPLEGTLMLVKVKGKRGVINSDGVYMIKPEIDSMDPLGSEGWEVLVKSKRGIMDPKGHFTVEPVYDDLSADLEGYFKVWKGGKCGLLARDGKTLIAASYYTDVLPFGDYWKVKKGDKTGLYDLGRGVLLSKVDFEDVGEPLSVNGHTYVPVRKNELWGAVDETGREVVKYRNNTMDLIRAKNMYYVTRNDVGSRLWFPESNAYLEVTIDHNGQAGPFNLMHGRIAEPTDECPTSLRKILSGDERKEWRRTAGIRRSLYAGFDGGYFSLLTDVEGRLVSDEATGVKPLDRFFLVDERNGYDLYDGSGVIMAKGLTKNYRQAGDWWIFNNKALSPMGEVLTGQKCGEQQFMQSKDGLWHPFADGWMADEGYEYVELGDGYIHCRRGGKWGVLNGAEEIVKCNNQERVKFSTELNGFWLTDGKRHGLVSKTGQVIIPTEFTNIKADSFEDLYVVENERGVGVYDVNGAIRIDPIYTTLKHNGMGGHYWAQLNGKYGVLDISGQEIIPVKYADEDLQIIDNCAYVTTEGGRKRYFGVDGIEMAQKRMVKVRSQEMIHNNYDSNNVKGFKLDYAIDTEFMRDETFTAEIRVFNINGTPARNNSGKPIKWQAKLTPTYLFCSFKELWFTMGYAQFAQPRNSRREYYLQLRFLDSNGREIATEGNDRISFYFTRD